MHCKVFRSRARHVYIYIFFFSFGEPIGRHSSNDHVPSVSFISTWNLQSHLFAQRSHKSYAYLLTYFFIAFRVQKIHGLWIFAFSINVHRCKILLKQVILCVLCIHAYCPTVVWVQLIWLPLKHILSVCRHRLPTHSIVSNALKHSCRDLWIASATYCRRSWMIVGFCESQTVGTLRRPNSFDSNQSKRKKKSGRRRWFICQLRELVCPLDESRHTHIHARARARNWNEIMLNAIMMMISVHLSVYVLCTCIYIFLTLTLIKRNHFGSEKSPRTTVAGQSGMMKEKNNNNNTEINQ